MFSVVIPLYNKEKNIFNTVQSVIDQTFQDFEIVVVNDGSTDKSAEIVESIRDSRVRLVHQENQGVSAARNKGIKEASYEWIAFLDGDDLWEKEHLETHKKIIGMYPEEKVFTTSFKLSNQLSDTISDYDVIETINNYFKEALEQYVTCSSVICVNRRCFSVVGFFNEKYCRGEDIDMWARLGKQYKFIKSLKVTAIYIQDSENKLTQKMQNLDKYFYVSDFKNTEKYEKKYWLKLGQSLIAEGIYSKNIKRILELSRVYKLNTVTMLYNILVSKINNRK